MLPWGKFEFSTGWLEAFGLVARGSEGEGHVPCMYLLVGDHLPVNVANTKDLNVARGLLYLLCYVYERVVSRDGWGLTYRGNPDILVGLFLATRCQIVHCMFSFFAMRAVPVYFVSVSGSTVLAYAVAHGKAICKERRYRNWREWSLQ